MKKSELKAFIKEEIKSILTTEIVEEQALKEMAKIKGDLKTSIEKVINDNPDLDRLPLKKAIKADSDVQSALGDESLFDNQLNKFISLTKGERELEKRGRKSDPNKPKKEKTTSSNTKGRPKSTKKKDDTLGTSKLGGRKYYAKSGEEEEGPSDAELRKLVKSGGSIGKDKISQLRQQEKTKLVKAFLKDLKSKGIVDSANRVLDKEKYDSEKEKAMKDINAKLKQIS